ncbi:unnamed protein product [Strongylus vulgaris]|uniref:60S ribosomal export protein NMD3 n=1 Tax=Strongylus vulgaris TaxID=40348 RepID=A0A3P7L7H9_STRVU|nr:unnamed protein product [Strongylus vulgaris]
MEEFHADTTVGLIACCQCGLPIQPNAANMCSGCIRSKVDITEGISRTATIYICKFCDRYFVPPSGWMRAEPESRELLSICLKKMKPQLLKVRLTDACFVWTEAHSKRIKVKLTIQKEVFNNTILQQTFVVEFTVHNQIRRYIGQSSFYLKGKQIPAQITNYFASTLALLFENWLQCLGFSRMCDDCRRAEAKDFWRACVQVRQKAEFKKTLFYLEQLLLKHGAHNQCTGVKPVPTGIDFFFAKLQEARKFVDFLLTVLPCKYHYAQELVSHDTKNNTYDYKHTFCVEIVPICRDNIVCMPKKVAQQLGNMSQIVICLRVSNVITLIDPNNLQMADIQATTFWREPFESLCTPKQLSEFYVLDVEMVDNFERKAGHGFVSKKHVLADVWLVRSHQVGMSDAQTLSTRTHLGHLLNPGDLVLGNFKDIQS